MSNTVKIVSVNCQGLSDPRKRRDVFHYLRQKSYSIYLLQDTHFDRLYSERQVEDCEILDMVQDIPMLTLQEKTSLEGEITLAEASLALKNMKNYKSPGSDGFTAEFF